MQWNILGMLTLDVLSSVSGHPSPKAGCKTHIPKTDPACWETILHTQPFKPWCWRCSSLLLALSRAL